MGIMKTFARGSAQIRAAKEQGRTGPAHPEGSCALAVREIVGAPSSGDYDRDGDADAVDAWEKIPESHKHRTTDFSKAPRGSMFFFGGGSHGHGHVVFATGWFSRAMSTDVNGKIGLFSRIKLAYFRDVWHLIPLGWSDMIGGKVVPVGKVWRP